jgi:hypothetical protein
MAYLRILLIWSQRLSRDKKKTLRNAFLLCALFETLTGIAHPNYAQLTEPPFYTEPIFIIFQTCSIITTIYFLSLVEMAAAEWIQTIVIKNSSLKKYISIIIPVLMTLLSFAVILFIRGLFTALVSLTVSQYDKGMWYVISTSFLHAFKAMTFNYYIVRVFQSGNIANSVFINVIDHILRYLEPGLIGFNIYYILANPLSELTENDWFQAISCNPRLVRRIELNQEELSVHLQNVFEMEVDSVKYKVALVVDGIRYRAQDILLLVMMACLWIASMVIGLKNSDNIIYTILISVIHPIIYICLCWRIVRLREESYGNPMMYEIESFSEDYRLMHLKELSFKFSENDLYGCYQSFKNENITYLIDNKFNAESDIAYKRPWLIMTAFVVINMIMFDTLASWLYIMPIGFGDLLLLNDVIHRSTRPDALRFLQRYLIYSSLIYIVLLCTKFF